MPLPIASHAAPTSLPPAPLVPRRPTSVALHRPASPYTSSTAAPPHILLLTASGATHCRRREPHRLDSLCLTPSPRATSAACPFIACRAGAPLLAGTRGDGLPRRRGAGSAMGAGRRDPPARATHHRVLLVAFPPPLPPPPSGPRLPRCLPPRQRLHRRSLASPRPDPAMEARIWAARRRLHLRGAAWSPAIQRRRGRRSLAAAVLTAAIFLAARSTRGERREEWRRRQSPSVSPWGEQRGRV